MRNSVSRQYSNSPPKFKVIMADCFVDLRTGKDGKGPDESINTLLRTPLDLQKACPLPCTAPLLWDDLMECSEWLPWCRRQCGPRSRGCRPSEPVRIRPDLRFWF